MQEADEKIVGYAHDIANKVIAAIENGLNLNGQLTELLKDKETFVSLNHYVPVTQNKLKRCLENHKLTVTEDGRIESFLAHQDLNPLSILIYRDNETNGLEVEFKSTEGMKKFHPVKLNGDKIKDGSLQPIVLVGRMTELLTDGVLKGAPHRVVATPLASGETFKRDAISIFININPERTLKPLLQSKDGPHFEAIKTSDYFMKFSASYTKAAHETSIKELSESALKPFPTDDEIEQKDHIYRRKL
jgi:isopenicillin N synthase-like dioxygenase